jgi:hypothetical protein
MLFAGNKIAHTLMRLHKPAIEPAIARFRGFVGHFARKFSGCFRVHPSHFQHGNQGRQESQTNASIEHSTRSSSIALRLRCCTPGRARQRPSPLSHTISTILCSLKCLLLRTVGFPTQRACILFCRHARCPRPNALPEFIGLQIPRTNMRTCCSSGGTKQ